MLRIALDDALWSVPDELTNNILNAYLYLCIEVKEGANYLIISMLTDLTDEQVEFTKMCFSRLNGTAEKMVNDLRNDQSNNNDDVREKFRCANLLNFLRSH